MTLWAIKRNTALPLKTPPFEKVLLSVTCRDRHLNAMLQGVVIIKSPKCRFYFV